MKRLRFAFLLVSLFLPGSLIAQDPLQREMRYFPFGAIAFEGFPIDAPQGYRMLDSPSAEGKIVREVPGPVTVTVVNYIERDGQRFYLTTEQQSQWWDDPSGVLWTSFSGTGRTDYIDRSEPARIARRETRDLFKIGAALTEIWEETLPVEPETAWNDAYLRAELDALLPAKILSFRLTTPPAWEATLRLFPAFDSNPERIPGPKPETYGELARALVSLPSQREVILKGDTNGETIRSVLVPNTVWATGFSEGRVQYLRTGWIDVPPMVEVSRLSPPRFTRGDPKSFRFAATRLNDTPALIDVTPGRIRGADFTDFLQIAMMGGPFGSGDEGDMNLYLQEQWNIELGSDQEVVVVAPLAEGRGAAGMLELESLSLIPSYREDLEALSAFGAQPAPDTPEANTPGWFSVLEQKVGEIPASQR